MQLISLWVEDYKNLKDFTINFENQGNLSILIGNNGSGKSNILEVLSGIFADLYSHDKHIESSYRLVYKINDQTIEVGWENTEHKTIVYYNLNGKKTDKRYLQTQMLIPSRVIALYSGEDTRLYTNYYAEFTKDYIRNLSTSIRPRIPLIYIDKKFWDIALLAFIIKAYRGDIDSRDFLKEELNINEVLGIHLEFDPKKYTNVKQNSPLDILIKRINSGEKPLLGMSIDFFYPMVESYEVEELFNIFSQGILYGLIKGISFRFNDDSISSENLSEGEKKKLLAKAALDVVGTENSLILMDEPDAYLHIEAKRYLYNLVKEFTKFDRSIVLTTHSPTLTNCADNKHLHMLARKDDSVSIVDDEKKKLIRKLTSNIWNAEEQNIFLNSDKTLLLVEGMDDVIYIRKAIQFFSDEYPLNVDLLYFGGAQNSFEFIQNLKKIGNLDSKKIIVLFDRDQGGIEGLKGCVKSYNPKHKTQLNQINLKDNNVYFNKNYYFLTYPKTNECTKSNEFTIENYFSIKVKTKVIKQKIKQDPYNIKNYKGLDEAIKRNIRKSIEDISPTDMVGFKTLLQKISNIIEHSEETFIDIQSL